MKKLFTIITVLLLALSLAACGSSDDNQSTNTGSNGSETTSADVSDNDSRFPMTIKPTVASAQTEDNGTVAFEDVTFEKQPEKIVVFDYGFLDTLDALSVEGIVGVVKGDTMPSYLKDKYNTDAYSPIGNLKTPAFEDIAALEPDVIFISGRQSAFYEELKEIAPVVFVGTSQDDYWNTFLASVEVAAQLFDKEAEAQQYLSQFDSKLEEIRQLASNFETALVTMYNEGKLSGFATNSRFGYMYDIYGFTPVTNDITASSHGSDFGFEAILEFNPQVLFVIDRTAAVSTGQSNIQADLENEIIKRTQAYKNNHIVYLDGALWYLSGGGLQSEMMKIQEILDELQP